MMGITRQELFKSLGVIKEGPQIDDWTERAYNEEESRRHKEEPYLTTSFHCSSYPGSEKNCRCYQLYKLMNIPEEKPMSAKGVGIVNVGKCVEEQIVERWHKMGILLTPYPKQLYIENETLWLTGYIDAVLNISPDYDSPLPVEIKSKSNKAIEYMKVGGQSYDEKHYNQLQAYISWCISKHKKMGWDRLGLNEAKGGIIYYVSREDPRNTHEFYVEYDPDVASIATETLLLWRQCFTDDVLPERPKEWRWTEEPCKWNPYKKLCKADYKDKIVKLSESNAVKFALEQDPSYNLETIKRRVQDRWIQIQQELF